MSLTVPMSIWEQWHDLCSNNWYSIMMLKTQDVKKEKTMKKISWIIVAFVTFVLGCGLTAIVPKFVVPPANAGAQMQRWESLCTHVNVPIGRKMMDKLQETANQAGLEGWEMVSFDRYGNVCFKRPQ